MWRRLRSALGRLLAAPAAPPAMERAVVRCVPSEPKLTLRLVLPDGSARHMQRDKAEPLGRVLARIAANTAKGNAKAAKKSKKARAAGSPAEEAPAEAPAVRLFSCDGEVVAEEVPNAAAWQDGAVLHIGEARYRVERNRPALTELRLPRSLLAGFPVCPKVSTEFAAPQHCLFRWYREQRPSAGGEAAAGDGPDWVETAVVERVFIPSNALVGLRLKLQCTPGDGAQRYGLPREVESSGPVEAGPGACIFDSRHAYTRKVCGEGSVRTVTYNILADIYAQTEYSRTVLYPYCAPYALELDYRQNLLKKELAGYSADLICLQEVDKSVFVDSLAPALDAFGLEGLFKIKEKQHEGLATFYRRDKFSLLSQHDIAFSEALLSDPVHKVLCDKLAKYPLVQEKVLQRSSVLQVSVLQSTSDPSRKICVANTHLYWHPKGGHIRLVQIAVALSHIKHVACDLYPSIPVIFCGDFNSTPSSGTYSFINSGSIAEDHEDWVSNGEEEKCNMPLSHPFKLLSACGEPAYTNYVGGFHGCLDYIFIDRNSLEVEQVIPLPSHEEVTTHQALPSVSHPSDHIALICDLKWK
ncbi:2',5'-phosphodiesterase 12 [Pezoporus wallicus]|uniref:2',5'-phosphodiesterase 12 n=1 Tax=Pezoporus wallicus TaxID=35540 RepID=UPI00254F11EB|nr:2',5'-phosphodiesterase 12 [Pezoporus wallicus]XP_061311892.1 2',5'-phosphodiesterase 12 [Pezoporus flaviventris]